MKIGTVIMAVIMVLSGLCSCSVEEVPAEIPEIVFLRTYDPNVDGGIYSCDFYDKNGDHYITTDPYVCGLTVRELLTEYSAGELDDMITLHTSCDKEELTENYVKFYNAAKGGNCGLAYLAFCGGISILMKVCRYLGRNSFAAWGAFSRITAPMQVKTVSGSMNAKL